MASEELAQHAMSTLNGQMLDDRPIRIDLANPKPERTDRDDRGGMRGGDRGGDRGGYRSDRGNDRGGDRGERSERGYDRGGRDRFSGGGGGGSSRSYDRGSRY